MNEKNKEKLFDEFLDSEIYDEFEELLFHVAKKSFYAGYNAKKPVVIPRIIVTGGEKE